MKRKRLYGILSAVICLVLLLGLISSCAGDTAQGASPASPAASPSASAPAALASPSASPAASPSTAPDGMQTVTDMDGNQVTIPATVNKVYCTSPIGTYIVYALAPDKLLGWNNPLSDAAKPYIDEKYQDLPSLGGTMGGQNSFNVEAIIALKPDFILDMNYNHENSDMLKQLAAQSGIPVVEISSGLKDTPESLRTLGKILGVEARGNALSDYTKKILDSVSASVAKVPDSEKLKLYYVESADGLATDGTDSMHTEVINFVNAANVVTMDTSTSGKGTKVSMEQVISWNPDVIVANAQMGGGDFVKTVYTDSTWAGINAVKNHRIYLPAGLPFNWFDRPPSIARILGVEWLAYELYPKYVTVDLKSDVKTFYKTMYGVDITDDQANTLINGTIAK
jgi:iron complex transport system substrate-binding protein